MAQSILSRAHAHSPSTSPATWREALEATKGVPDSFELLKVLVFKPRTAKNVAPVPVIVIAREETETNSTALGKKLNLKEMRLATEDLLVEVFGVNKDGISPLSLTAENFPKVLTVLDGSLASAAGPFAVHANSDKETVFLHGQEIVGYLRSLEVTDTKITEVDFVALKADATANAPLKDAIPAQAKTATTSRKEDAKIEGAVQIAVGIQKELDFPGWYTNVLIKSDMLDYYSVSGCYILKPWSYSIWEAIQQWFDGEIKEMGVENAYFPLFVSAKVLEKEKDHVEGFAPEVAWVTRAGNTELEEPIAIRPTSETVMYPYYAKWIQSHRDLPLRLNQWNSVVRWEFKNPQPFLRTREFLWQEGHTAHLTKEGAGEEVLQILELYRRVYEELLAVPVIPGIKSEKEKFAGGLYTTTLEGFISTTGRGIQAATSHCLGQNFSKMFNIVVEDPNAGTGENASKIFVWQNSWGLSTRTIGVMVMVHGDNQGLVLPPRVASIQVIIVPCGVNAKTSDEMRKRVPEECDALAKKLKKAGIKAKADLRDGYTPGYKFNDWELKGVPIRLEIGPADLEKQQTVAVRRDTGAKTPLKMATAVEDVKQLLETIQSDMYNKAKATYNSRVKIVTEWKDFVPTLDSKCVVIMPWCEIEACEDDIKERSGRVPAGEQVDERAPSAGAKSLAFPLDQTKYPKIEHGKTKCPACGENAKRWMLFGRSY
ncbi:prolyl-tRNA synthetase [Dacryopinax primogenitus]|uniref:proline--tRNA ligase n=1 Tax=Dacryopinax primogenitus (strain DJM 731) TaxID=1858805 RepID=M5FUT7_DACPD|nr:prolyl-tRNA synthetase [Dacryopinax primogenitus]EJT99274.1 prolyl-tRNA synthetase [Dacryopinax primogenitus]